MSNRRQFVAAAAAITSAAILGHPATAQQASPAATGTFPRDVEGTFGMVTIPAKPERVAAVSDWYEVDYLMAQGVSPIIYGYTNRWDQGLAPWLAEVGGDGLPFFDFEGSAEVDVEALAAAAPDLIIADPYLAEQVIDQLNGIAPTIGIPTPYSGSNDWRDAQIVVGEATGNEAEAAAAIAETEAVIAAGAELLAPYADRTVTVAYTTAYNGGSLFFAPDDSQEAALIRALGLNFAGHTDNSPQSMESLDLLADVDILLSYDDADNQEFLEGNELFQILPVATNGQYTTITPLESRAIFAPTTLSVRWVIPALVEAITAAAEGNGKVVGEG